MSLSAEELDSINADLWTMSPPCQPFTRQGNQKDIEDNRTNPLRHIQREMTKMKNLPKYFFLENVKGFETSLARDQLISTLKQCGYHFREFLLSPNQFGIPNSRLRYYLVAKANADFRLECDRLITETVVNQSPTRLIAEYMEDKPEAYFEKFLVDDKLLLKYAEIFDITSAESCRSCCFTKAYSHYVRGTGSVIQQAAVDINEIYTLFRQSASNEEKLQQIQKLKLRFFTPKEILNLSGFGKDFSFPGETSLRQQYQLLGNSINVDVVAHLLEILLSNTLHSKPIC
uniref:tRNA (cytosine(38)-C(5))-methyltransferase n=1 Tax=Romanomermis culicivorax TaxID=13658 RepID=A0A915JW35_ROMCU